jgi:hypothetical protein
VSSPHGLGSLFASCTYAPSPIWLPALLKSGHPRLAVESPSPPCSLKQHQWWLSSSPRRSGPFSCRPLLLGLLGRARPSLACPPMLAGSSPMVPLSTAGQIDDPPVLSTSTGSYCPSRAPSSSLTQHSPQPCLHLLQRSSTLPPWPTASLLSNSVSRPTCSMYCSSSASTLDSAKVAVAALPSTPHSPHSTKMPPLSSTSRSYTLVVAARCWTVAAAPPWCVLHLDTPTVPVVLL